MLANRLAEKEALDWAISEIEASVKSQEANRLRLQEEISNVGYEICRLGHVASNLRYQAILLKKEIEELTPTEDLLRNGVLPPIEESKLITVGEREILEVEPSFIKVK